MEKLHSCEEVHGKQGESVTRLLIVPFTEFLAQGFKYVAFPSAASWEKAEH